MLRPNYRAIKVLLLITNVVVLLGSTLIIVGGAFGFLFVYVMASGGAGGATGEGVGFLVGAWLVAVAPFILGTILSLVMIVRLARHDVSTPIVVLTVLQAVLLAGFFWYAGIFDIF
jgi:hypothetical protein